MHDRRESAVKNLRKALGCIVAVNIIATALRLIGFTWSLGILWAFGFAAHLYTMCLMPFIGIIGGILSAALIRAQKRRRLVVPVSDWALLVLSLACILPAAVMWISSII